MNAAAYPPILNYLCQLTAETEPSPVETVLHCLREMLGASGIGVSCLDDPAMDCSLFSPAMTSPETRLWQTDAGLVERLRGAVIAEPRQDSAGDWLVCLAWEPCYGVPLVAWLHRGAPPSPPLSRAGSEQSPPLAKAGLGGGWSEADRALWPIVAQTLVRWLSHQTGCTPTEVCLRDRKSTRLNSSH